ncbi:post-transcriptional regulator [Desemzia sp. FAM 23991]|uniref:post-transcriptional regulator n=1 Tax=unclassified Desemzia TaxID=2685243 RepID=UPI003888ED09
MVALELSFSQYEPWINLKAKEFNRLGYSEINAEDIWNYLVKFCWKRKQPVHYYARVKQIMSIEPNHYLDFASLEAQVKVSSLDEMDLNAFF